LVSHGVTPDLVAAKGFGETEPLASNNTVAGRAQNRRVEITVAPAATS
jgi:chemotaxis protein MotB